MEKEFNIFGNTELHDRAIRELYTGNDIDKVLPDKPFSKYIFYDVLTPQNELVPIGLIVSCSGKKEDMLRMMEDDMLARLFNSGYAEELGTSRIYDTVSRLGNILSDRFSNVGKTVFIKDISMKEDCTNASERISGGIRECINESGSSTAICITDADNDVMDLIEDRRINVELIDELGDLRVWGIEA